MCIGSLIKKLAATFLCIALCLPSVFTAEYFYQGQSPEERARRAYISSIYPGMDYYDAQNTYEKTQRARLAGYFRDIDIFDPTALNQRIREDQQNREQHLRELYQREVDELNRLSNQLQNVQNSANVSNSSSYNSAQNALNELRQKYKDAENRLNGIVSDRVRDLLVVPYYDDLNRKTSIEQASTLLTGLSASASQMYNYTGDFINQLYSAREDYKHQQSSARKQQWATSTVAVVAAAVITVATWGAGSSLGVGAYTAIAGAGYQTRNSIVMDQKGIMALQTSGERNFATNFNYAMMAGTVYGGYQNLSSGVNAVRAGSAGIGSYLDIAVGGWQATTPLHSTWFKGHEDRLFLAESIVSAIDASKRGFNQASDLASRNQTGWAAAAYTNATYTAVNPVLQEIAKRNPNSFFADALPYAQGASAIGGIALERQRIINNRADLINKPIETLLTKTSNNNPSLLRLSLIHISEPTRPY